MKSKLPKHFHIISNLFKQYGVPTVYAVARSGEDALLSATNELITEEDVDAVYDYLKVFFDEHKQEEELEYREKLEDLKIDFVSFADFMKE